VRRSALNPRLAGPSDRKNTENRKHGSKPGIEPALVGFAWLREVQLVRLPQPLPGPGMKVGTGTVIEIAGLSKGSTRKSRHKKENPGNQPHAKRPGLWFFNRVGRSVIVENDRIKGKSL